MLCQVVVALIPATIQYRRQASLDIGTHGVERYVSNIVTVQNPAPCVYYLLQNSGEGQVTIKNVIFYTDISVKIPEFAQCEQVDFAVFRGTNLALENVTIVGNIDITFSSLE